MKTTATVAIAALVTLANSAGTLAFDNRPMQFMSKDGEIVQTPIKESTLTYDSPNQTIEWKQADALSKCWAYCDSAAHATADAYLIGNVQVSESSDEFTCRCYDSRDGPFHFNGDSSWSSFHCVPAKNFPCHKSK